MAFSHAVSIGLLVQSCRCDTEAQEIVLTAAAVNESQLQASNSTALLFIPTLCTMM